MAYFPFLAETLYTNHSLPNIRAFFYQYPSYRTMLEHRFAQDILMNFLGAPGTPFLCLFFSLIVQILNGFFAVKLFHFTGKFPQFVFCLFISLYPYIWDYYGFGTDHLSFVLGDTCVLLAFLTIGKRFVPWCFVGIFLLFLSLGFHPGKLSLICTLGLLYILKDIKDCALDENKDRSFIRNILHVVVLVFGGTLLYFISLKLAQNYYIPVVDHNASRLAIGSFYECWERLEGIYRRTWYFWVGRGQGGWFVFKPFVAFLLFLCFFGWTDFRCDFDFKKKKQRKKLKKNSFISFGLFTCYWIFAYGIEFNSCHQ